MSFLHIRVNRACRSLMGSRTILQLALVLCPPLQAVGLKAKPLSQGLFGGSVQVGQHEFAQQPEPRLTIGPSPMSKPIMQPVRLEDIMEFPDYIEDPTAQGMGHQARRYYETMYNKSEWLAMEPPRLTAEQESELTSGTDGRNNFCMNGHLVPEFMVIGAIKTSTTSLCIELRRSPALIWSVNNYSKHQKSFSNSEHYWKEGHYFDNNILNSSIREFIMDKLPNCSTQKRLVAVEATPRYSSDPYVPKRMSEWYGPVKKTRLKFLFMIRDPLSRLLSHYWHSIASGWCLYHQDYSFLEIIDGVFLANPRTIPAHPTRTCTDFEKGSFYASQLLGWFDNFSPKQFTLVPYLFNVAPQRTGYSKQPVAEYVWKLLGVRGTRSYIVPHANGHEHPSLARELDPVRIQSMNEYFDHFTGPNVLAGMLANSGAQLYNYKGDTGNKETIAQWIADNWGDP